MKRKIIPSTIISLIIIASLIFTFTVFGNDVSWRYDSETKTIYISGSGAMDNYENVYVTPWYSHIHEVENVVIEEGVTTVGANAFSGAENLTDVSIADSVTSINEFAFASCQSLMELKLSEHIISIADDSFAYDGVTFKNFTVYTPAGSYALHYILSNNLNGATDRIQVKTERITCGNYTAKIVVPSMLAVYPYTPKYDGLFQFYSSGSSDTVGFILDEEYNVLYSNDDISSNNTNFSINEAQLQKDHTYYFTARIMNSSLYGSFDITIAPVEYTVSGSIFAMNDPSGTASDMQITEALLDGEETNGIYTRTVTEDNANATVTVGDFSFNYTFSPDNDEVIIINVCDVNSDGYVNGRDYAYLKTSNSRFKTLFVNFI